MEIRTPKEWIEDEQDFEVVWVHSLDLLAHVLKADPANTKYKGRVSTYDQKYKQIITEALEEGPGNKDNGFHVALQDKFKPKNKWNTKQANGGPRFSVAGYIKVKAGSTGRKAKPFEKYVKDKKRRKKAMTILFETCINSGMVNGKEMQERHKTIYNLVLHNEANQIPTRVVACLSSRGDHKGCGKEMTYKMFIVVKDYNERIYPGIWGALKTNKTTNAFQNMIHNYFTGTHEYGNGHSFDPTDAADYLPEEEDVVILKAKFWSYKGVKDHEEIMC